MRVKITLGNAVNASKEIMTQRRTRKTIGSSGAEKVLSLLSQTYTAQGNQNKDGGKRLWQTRKRNA